MAIEGGQLHSVRVGGPDCDEALLVLHGGPGLSHEPMRALDALASVHRCIVYFDQRGVGLSTGPEGSWTALDLAADIDAVRTAWDLRKVDVIGHSWGAYLAALYAAEHGNRVRAMVFSSPAPLTPDGWEAFARGMRERISRLRTLGTIPPPIPLNGDDCAASTEALSPAYLFDPNREIRERHAACSTDSYNRTWAALPRQALASVAEHSRARATLIQGEGEVRGPEIIAEWEAIYAGKLTVERIDACGHLLHTECPEIWLERIGVALAR